MKTMKWKKHHLKKWYTIKMNSSLWANTSPSCSSRPLTSHPLNKHAPLIWFLKIFCLTFTEILHWSLWQPLLTRFLTIKNRSRSLNSEGQAIWRQRVQVAELITCIFHRTFQESTIKWYLKFYRNFQISKIISLFLKKIDIGYRTRKNQKIKKIIYLHTILRNWVRPNKILN
jgi:hypothetical protein